MTREEQAKKDCAIIVNDCVESGTIYASGYNKGIEMGVKWADSHPNWHKYPDEKPTEDYKWFLTYCYDGSIIANQWGCKENKWRVFMDEDVIAWIEFPKPPKFD